MGKYQVQKPDIIHIQPSNVFLLPYYEHVHIEQIINICSRNDYPPNCVAQLYGAFYCLSDHCFGFLPISVLVHSHQCLFQQLQAAVSREKC